MQLSRPVPSVPFQVQSVIVWPYCLGAIMATTVAKPFTSWPRQEERKRKEPIFHSLKTSPSPTSYHHLPIVPS